jgi:hypothetical protein
MRMAPHQGEHVGHGDVHLGRFDDLTGMPPPNS